VLLYHGISTITPIPAVYRLRIHVLWATRRAGGGKPLGRSLRTLRLARGVLTCCVHKQGAGIECFQLRPQTARLFLHSLVVREFTFGLLMYALTITPGRNKLIKDETQNDISCTGIKA
jgi:hypothetical protein